MCVFYSNKIKFKDDFASLSLLLLEETEEDESKEKNAASTNYYKDGELKTNSKVNKSKHTKSEINEKLY